MSIKVNNISFWDWDQIKKVSGGVYTALSRMKEDIIFDYDDELKICKNDYDDVCDTTNINDLDVIYVDDSNHNFKGPTKTEESKDEIMKRVKEIIKG